MAYTNVIWIAGVETGNLNEFSTGAGVASGTEKHSGSYSLRMSQSDVSTVAFSAKTEIVVRIWFYVTASRNALRKDSLFRFQSGAPSSLAQCRVQSSFGGSVFGLTLWPTGGTETTLATGLAEDTWHRLELRCKKGTGSDQEIGGRLNGASEVVANDGTTTADIEQFQIHGDPADTGEYIYFDDMVALDTATYPNVVTALKAIRMDGDSGDSGEDEWEDEGAAAQTYDSVNQDPLDETAYAIESSQADADHRQLWTLGTIADVGTINHVRIGVQAKRGAGSGTEHRIRAKVSTAENSADLGLDVASAYYTFDPTTQPSTQAELDSFQAGVWRNSGGREFYCYEQWVMVDYTPPAAGTAVKDIIGGGIIPWAR